MRFLFLRLALFAGAVALASCAGRGPLGRASPPRPEAPPPSPLAIELASAEAEPDPADASGRVDRWSPEQPVVPRERTRAVVLLYHRFSQIHGQGRMSPGVFDLQLKLLKDEGIEIVPLSKLVDWIEGKRLLPERVAAITLDDGERPHFTVAYPVLKRNNAPFSLAIPTHHIEAGHVQGRVDWEMLKTMMASGLAEVVSHSHTHPRITRLGKPARTTEIVLSKQILEKRLGTPIDIFAYPLGAHTDWLVHEVRDAGYRAGLSVVGKPIDHRAPRFAIPRYEIAGNAGVHTLKAYLKLAKMLATPAPVAGGGVAAPRAR